MYPLTPYIASLYGVILTLGLCKMSKNKKNTMQLENTFGNAVEFFE